MTLKKSLCLILTLLLSIVCVVACTPNEPTDPPKATLTKLEIDPYSVANDCYVGDKLDITTISVTATYSDGTSKVLSYDDITVNSFPNTEEDGETSLVITYDGKSATLPIIVNEVTLKSITPIGFQDSYIWGETISIENVKLRLSYTNGTSKEIPLSEAKANGANVTLPNTKIITEGSEEKAMLSVSYLGKTFTMAVDIINPIVKIELDSKWRTFAFKYNATESQIENALSNVKVYAIHANGEKVEKSFSDLTIYYNEIDVTQPTQEQKSFTIKYSIFTVTATYTVSQAPEYIGIGFGTGHSFKNRYLPGETIDSLDTIKVRVIKADNTEIDEIPVGENLTVVGYDAIDTNVPGVYTLTLVYTDADGESISFVEKIVISAVKSVSISGFNTDLAIGDKFDSTFESFNVTVEYDDGTVLEFLYKDRTEAQGILADEVKINSNVDTSKAGSYIVTVEYLESSSYVTVSVNENDIPNTDSDNNVTDKVGLV